MMSHQSTNAVTWRNPELHTELHKGTASKLQPPVAHRICSSVREQDFTITSTAIGTDLKAFLTAAFVASWIVDAELGTAGVSTLTFIKVWRAKDICVIPGTESNKTEEALRGLISELKLINRFSLLRPHSADIEETIP